MTSDDPTTLPREPHPSALPRWLDVLRRHWLVVAAAALVALSLTLPFLADSAAERSDRAVAAAEASIAAGQDDTAQPLLAEALQLNPQNRKAEQAMAELYLRKGQIGRAQAIYQAIIARDPANIGALVALAGIGLQRGDTDTARGNAESALAIDPDNADARATMAMLKVKEAVGAADPAALVAAAAEARAILQTAPDNLAALRAVIAAALAGPDPAAALPAIDHAIDLTGGAYEFEDLKFTTLQKSGQAAAMSQQLEDMYRRFPGRPELGERILALYDRQGNVAGARALLFDRALQSGFAEAPTAALLDYLRSKGAPGDERAMLDQIVAQASDPVVRARYVLAAAQLDAAQGRAAAAETALRGLLQDGAAGDIAVQARASLAAILLSDGKQDEATALVDQILASHPGTVAALKLRARMEIDGGDTAQALTALQAAVDQSQRDSEVMLMMAEAYEKSGALPLAGDRYALAVEYSGNGIAESLQSAAFLNRTGRIPAAAEVLNRAIAAHPGNLALLGAAAALYSDQLDWGRARAMIDAMTAIGTPEATAAADAAGQAIVTKQAALATARQVLTMAQTGPAADTARAAGRILDQGDPAGALAYLLDPARGAAPGVLTIRATLFALTGQTGEAETQLRTIFAADPSDSVAFLALYRLLQQTSRADDASGLLDQSLAASQPPVSALLVAADLKAEAGDTPEAIRLTEAAYQRDPGNADTAALLARRITLDPQATPDALRRARDLATPLRSLDRPLTLDTLGWIEVRLGNPGSGLVDLQSAGRVLPDDLVIRFHRAMALYDLDRKIEARDELQTYLALPGDKPAANVEQAQTALDRLNSGQ